MRVPPSPPDWREVLRAQPELLLSLQDEELMEFVRRANDDYLHWNKLRYRTMPAALIPATNPKLPEN